MDVEYTWILRQGKIYFNLGCYLPCHLLVSSFIQYEGRVWDKEEGLDRYFSSYKVQILLYMII